MICILSMLEQNPIDTVTPMLDADINSDRLVVAIFDKQAYLFERIKKVLQPRGIKVSCVFLPEEITTEALVSFFEEVFTKELLEADTSEVVFNASGGAKRYLLAASEVSHQLGLSSFVIEPCCDELYWLRPRLRENGNLADKIGLKDYLFLNGYDVELSAQNELNRPELNETVRLWAKYCQDSEHAMRKLNYLAYTARDNLISAPWSANEDNDFRLAGIIKQAQEQGLLRVYNSALHFSSEEARFYLNGGWLEALVFSEISKIKRENPILQDAQQSLVVRQSANNNVTCNELDVIALANNKLHIIECKTKHFKQGNGNDVVYKIDSLADALGGLQARGAIVTFHQINQSTRDRAKLLSIRIFEPIHLPRLYYHLSEWIKLA